MNERDMSKEIRAIIEKSKATVRRCSRRAAKLQAEADSNRREAEAAQGVIDILSKLLSKD